MQTLSEVSEQVDSYKNLRTIIGNKLTFQVKSEHLFVKCLQHLFFHKKRTHYRFLAAHFRNVLVLNCSSGDV